MKKKAAIFCMILMIGLLAGCAKNNPQQMPPEAAQPNTEEEAYVAGPQIELYAYDAVEDQQYVTIYELKAGEDVTADNVVAAYQTQVMEGVYGQAVGINKVTTEGSRLYIDFNAADMEKLDLGSGIEGSYYGNLAASIATNIADITEIYYSMDGRDFETGHLLFAKDEPFWYTHEDPVE